MKREPKQQKLALLDYLPAIYHSQAEEAQPLHALLQVIHLFFSGIERSIDDLHQIFDPYLAPQGPKFQITSEVLENLRKIDLSETAIKNLSSLKDEEKLGTIEFLERIKNTLDNLEEFKAHISSILKFSQTKECPFFSFRMTREVLDRLKQEDLPQSLLNALESLLDKTIFGRTEFENIIRREVQNQVHSEESRSKYYALILRYVAAEPPMGFSVSEKLLDEFEDEKPPEFILEKLDQWRHRVVFGEPEFHDVVTEELGKVFRDKKNREKYRDLILKNSVRSLPSWMPSTNDDFLSWLASWVVLHLDESWSIEKKRYLVRNAGNFYCNRGTLIGLRYTLEQIIGVKFEVKELEHTPSIAIGLRSTIGINSTIGKRPDPTRFMVLCMAPITDEKLIQKINLVIDLEKPAHTKYFLYFHNPEVRMIHPMIIETQSRIGFCKIRERAESR